MSAPIEAESNQIYHLSTRKALAEHLFIKREIGFSHAPFEREIAFYESVCSGNLETVKTLFTHLGGEGFGMLCPDPLQNLKYHLVVSIAMITRFCISCGMQPETAYSLSDIFIQKTDACHNENEIHELHYNLTIDYTKRMRQIRSGRMYSRTLLLILDYISDHLHERIFLEDIAESLSKSVPYLSRVFAKEMGMPISTYIMQKKIETSASMLQFSNYTALEISTFLGFSSQSYFIKQFKKQLGISPSEYRKRFYSVGWMNGGLQKKG